MEQFVDEAAAVAVVDIGSIYFKLIDTKLIFWDIQAIGAFTPQAKKLFTLTAEVVQD